MKTRISIVGLLAILLAVASVAFAAYHHEGEMDSDKFLAAYPEKAGTKLDHCALCHTGGSYERYEGADPTTLGSCQWCHYSYGYDGSGNIVDTLNQYGKDYYAAGRDQQAVIDIQGEDSDDDGYTNQAEIQANRFPGNADDDPGKQPAPFKVYSRAQLAALPQHTQFLLMNTSRSGDFYAQYSGVPVEDLLADAGMLDSATGITVFAPDGWSQYHPIELDETPEMYHIKDVEGGYQPATFYYDPEAKEWCDYSAPSVAGRNHGDPIAVEGGLKAILAYKREGVNLDPGILTEENKLDGEGPYRLVAPQKVPSPPDQSSRSDNQDVIWPYTEDWDHNAGACTRSVTIIRVEPLPEGTTDIDVLEAGWDYIDEEKVVVYGAIAGEEPLEYEQTQAIDTHEARSWESFDIDGVQHLAAANQAAPSAIYQWNGTAFVEIQQIDIPWVEVFESFVIDGETYLAMALNRNADNTSRIADSIIYKWDGQMFEAYQSIPTQGARDWESFEIGGVLYLALANERNDDTRNVDSMLYRWDDGQEKFIEAQAIPTKGARDWESFVIDGATYLAVANQEDSDKAENPRDIDSVIYKWDGTTFAPFQSILTHSARDWESVAIGGKTYLAVANNQIGNTRTAQSMIYVWNSADAEFDEFQSVITYGAHDMNSFMVDGATYLAVANNKSDETPTVSSDILKWDGSTFAEAQSIPTQGVRDFESFTIDGRTYLAAANDDSEYDPDVNITSRIYALGEEPAVEPPAPPDNDDDDDDDGGTCFIQSVFR
jgi:hypothetical protein